MIYRRQICVLVSIAAVAAAANAHADEGSTKKKGGGASYLQIDTLTATVLRDTGQRGVLTVEGGIDVPDLKLRARAALSLPRLRAAYVQRLQIYVAGLAPGAPPDPDYISRTLQTETDRVLGAPGAKLLLGAILIN